MKQQIDCLFIGHNEMEFAAYEKFIRRMGTETGAYRDLDLNFVWYEGRPNSASDIFNELTAAGTGKTQENATTGEPMRPLRPGDHFSNAVAYLGTYLHRRGRTIAYVNSFQDEKEELRRILEEEDVLTIAIITTLYVAALPIYEIMDYIKEYNQTAKVIVGGPFIANQVRIQDPLSLQYLLKDSIGADYYVVSNQGEAALVEIIRAEKERRPVDKIKNIYYRNGDEYVPTPSEPEANKLSENTVQWELFADRLKAEVVSVRASSSCPFSCSFCGFPERAGKYQAMEAEDIMKELNRLAGIPRVKAVQFIDDTFNIPKERFKEILRQMIKSRNPLNWISNYRSQYADREIVQMMKESGCEAVFLGIESGNNQILKNMNKAAVVERYHEGIALLNEYGIAAMGSFIVGFPGETDETVQDTIRFIEQSGIDFYRVQTWYCDPITPIWREREKYGLSGESFEWKHDTMDSVTAARITEDIFMKFEDPVWVPQQNFGFDKIWNLTHRGMTLTQVKDYLRAFNRGVKQKLGKPFQQEIGIDIMKQLREAAGLPADITGSMPGEAQEEQEEEIRQEMRQDNLGFDF